MHDHDDESEDREIISVLKSHFRNNIASQADADLEGWMNNCDNAINESINAILDAVDEVTFPEYNFRRGIMEAMGGYTRRCVELMLDSVMSNVSEDDMEMIVNDLRTCAGYEKYEDLLDDSAIEDEDDADGLLVGLKGKYESLVAASVPKDDEDDADDESAPTVNTGKVKPVKRIRRYTVFREE